MTSRDRRQLDLFVLVRIPSRRPHRLNAVSNFSRYRMWIGHDALTTEDADRSLDYMAWTFAILNLMQPLRTRNSSMITYCQTSPSLLGHLSSPHGLRREIGFSRVIQYTGTG